MDRNALENERNELLARIAEWDLRLDRAGSPSTGDYVLPPLLGCLIAGPAFLGLAVWMVRTYKEPPFQHAAIVTLLGAIVLFVLIAGFVALVRKMGRASRVADMRKAHADITGPLRRRVEEIDRMLLR